MKSSDETPKPTPAPCSFNPTAVSAAEYVLHKSSTSPIDVNITKDQLNIADFESLKCEETLEEDINSYMLSATPKGAW